MVLRQHATPELQHPFLHRKRIRMPFKFDVHRSKIAHGCACTSKIKNTSPHNQQSTSNASLHTCPSPIEGWFTGSTRRWNSSTLSDIASASACLPKVQYVTARLFIAAPARRIQKHITSQSTKHMKRITPHMPLTYFRIVLRQHATMELQCPYPHRKRIHIPSEFTVRRSNIPHGEACTMNKNHIPSPQST